MDDMQGSYQPPFQWLCGWCLTICRYINPFTLLWTLLRKCFPRLNLGPRLNLCGCDCCPDWCPRGGDLVEPEEVTAEDYMDEEDRTFGKGQLQEEGRMKAAVSSFVAFLGGMLLITLYAYIVLFWKSYNVWFCIISTVSMGFFLCIGMAFSMRIRITVLLMLPNLFSGHTRAILLVIILSMAMQGPAANTVENFQIATGSISCGVEVAMNQTRELFGKVTEPLMSALNFLRQMAAKVKGVAGKAKHYFQKFREYMKLISRTLHHVWAFITSIGDICNAELLNPYKKCLKAFENAKEDCWNMGFGPICNIVDAFTWLCGLAKIVTVICVVPSYIGDFMSKNVKAPIMSMLQDINHKFDFNMTINHDLGGTVNASKGVFTIVGGIMAEVKEDLDPYRELLHILSYSIFLISLFTYFMALRYLQQYTTDDNFDNIYITRQFVDLDGNRAKQGLTTLLPLSPRESYGLIRPMATTLTRKEQKGYSFEIMNIFRSLLLVSLIVLGDYVVFWVMEVISSIMNGDITVRAPYMLRANVTGSGFLNDIFSQLADALDALGKKNVTVIAKQCIPRASEPDYYGYLTIAALYVFTFFASLSGIYVHRLKRSVCAYYYPGREQERICFLFNNLLTNRMNLKTSLMKSIRTNIQDEGHRNILLILGAQIPGFSSVTTYFGSSERYCMACAKMSTPETSQDFTSCTTNGCKGLYCPGCCEILNNICVVCMGPLAYLGDIEEELDSSDDEQLHLWIAALNTLKQKRAEKKKLKAALKKRLKVVVKRRGMEADVIQQYRSARELDSDEESSGLSDGGDGTESGVTDYEYQNRSESESDGEDWPVLEEYREAPDPIPRRFIYPEGYRPKDSDFEKGYGP